MRIKQFLLAIILILIIGAAALAPWLDGQIFKQRYSDAIATLQQFYHSDKMPKDMRLNIAITQYDEGWLKSTAKLSFEFTRLDSSGKPLRTYNFTIDQHITHGPLIFDRMKRSWMLAEALIRFNLHVADDFEKLVLGDKARYGILQNETVLTFDNVYQSTFTMPAIHKIIKEVNVNWDGLKGNMQVALQDNKLKRMLSDVVIGALQLQAKKGGLTSQKIISSSNLTPDSSGLFSGMVYVSMPGFTFTSDNQTVTLNKLQFLEKSKIVADRYTYQIHFLLGQFVAPTYTIKQSNFDFALDDASAAGISNLLSAFYVFMQSAKTDSDKTQYLSHLPGVITPQTAISGNSTFDSSFGHLITDWLIKWPDGVRTLNDLVIDMNLKTDLRISVSLANTMIDNWSAQQLQQQQQSSAGTTVTNAENNPLSLTPNQAPAQTGPTPGDQMKQKINDLIKAGFITQQNDEWVTTVTMDKGVVKANGLPIRK